MPKEIKYTSVKQEEKGSQSKSSDSQSSSVLDSEDRDQETMFSKFLNLLLL